MGLEDGMYEAPQEGMTRRRFLSFGLLGLLGLSVHSRCSSGRRRFRRYRHGRWDCEYNSTKSETYSQNIKFNSQAFAFNFQYGGESPFDFYKKLF